MNLCIACGCDELHACGMDHVGFYAGCWWIRFDAEKRVGVCSACEDALKAWSAGTRAPILTLIAERFYRQVLFLYEDRASALAFMVAPQKLLRDRTPRELILEGRIAEVQALLDIYRTGAFA